jgi:hypothetical protein
LGDTVEDVRVDKLRSEDMNRIKLALDGLKWWNILKTGINYSIPLKRENFCCFVIDEMRLTVDIK